uniref:Chemokine interleukin-8-like domain-containing protein n=1 Tax=Sinocyclocheilus rhinocerous TaxID=307959 RepID=A0A673LS38_9TELE
MHYCILISCLVLFTFCSLAQNPDKCCFSFSNLEIPEREVESYMTNLECPRHGIIKPSESICTTQTTPLQQQEEKPLIKISVNCEF